jgi:formiminotetrahydrofolate cyclodeaminase
MTEDLLGLSTRDLLKKFGAGEHKPGSGSAAAFLGLLSINLCQTVISLTQQQPKYANVASVVSAHESRLNDLQAVLEDMFQRDSELFDLTIKLRRERDDLPPGPSPDRTRVQRDLAKATWKVTDLPLELVRELLELAEIAIDVFKLGFRSARGDSSVAAQAALAGANGALAIVFLNLQSTTDPARTRRALVAADELRKRSDRLIAELSRAEATLVAEAHERDASR